MHAHVRSAAVLASMMLALNCSPANAAGDTPAADAPAPANAKITVQVLGRVKHPGNVVLDSGARLSDALTAAGAFAIEPLVARVGGPLVPDTECTPGGAQLRYVFLSRTVDSSRHTAYMIDYAAVLKHDLRYDMLMRPDDKILVPECRTRSGIILPPPTFPRPFAGS
jgi:protein involved in polysaccharide export with SLBB domain